ncbi:MAG: FAD-dependent oxidoreductase [Nitrospirae bacterium]|nr:FAD-dependent oxidoreductase [Nitrospirota bacterium]
MTASLHLIVIGNGMAAGAVLEELVKQPERPAITVFGAESHGNYNRILLSDVLACAKTFDETMLNRREWYAEHGVALQAGVAIRAIDPAQREVVTQAGDRHHYDRLLLATGSTPFLPPIEGLGREGIFCFRNIDDTERMIAWAARHDQAVVVGGGLLGLEAARGLTNRGMVVTVVHLMSHLMEQQLDAMAGAILKEEIEKQGITARLNCTVQEVLGDGRVEAVRLSDGTVLPADMVVITAGIRPNVQLAREAGLAVQRGILVDDRLHTSQPDVYAVGECIEHRGKTYGLVAPILEQAKVVADAIIGGTTRSYAGSITATTLKVAGIHLTSMGDCLGKEAGAEELVHLDTGRGIYKKLVIRADRIVGAIFLGDGEGSREAQELMASRRDISAVRHSLLMGDGNSEQQRSPVALPDTSLICNCHAVTKGEIVGAIRDKRCATREQVAECTRATTGCGSCVPLVEQLLMAVLEGSTPAGLAASAPIAAAPPNKIEIWKKEKDGLDMMEEIDRYAREGWEAISEADVQRLKWYGLFLRTPTPGRFMIRVRIPNGIATAAQFRLFADISERFGKGFADLTTRQQIQLRNMRIEHVPEIFTLLRSVGLTSLQTGMDNIRNVMGCPVTGLSPTELIDTAPIVRQLTDLFVGNRDYSNLPRKFNAAITGCRENCLHAESQDLALIPATREIDGQPVAGFNLLAGGKMGSGGFRAARPLDLFVGPDDAAAVCAAIIVIYRDHGPRASRTKSRLSFLIEEWGVARFRAAVEERVGRPLARAGNDARDPRKKTDHVGAFRQKQPGLNYVGLQVPVGRITAAQMVEVARLAEQYGSGEIRLTPGQSLIVPNVPDQRLGALVSEPLPSRELTYNPSEVMRGLVSCTGIEYCGLAVIETKQRALRIARKLEQTVGKTKPVEIHWSGCPAGCGNHLLSDIGLLGKRAKAVKPDGSQEVVDAVDIFVGGRSGPNARPGVKLFEDVPCDRLHEVMEGLVRYVARDKSVDVLKGELISLPMAAGLTPASPEAELGESPATHQTMGEDNG